MSLHPWARAAYGKASTTMPEPLDHTQRQAARSHPDIPLIIRAGPGSGKTRVLEERIVLLTLHMRALGERRRRIKVLCFTRNATREIERRVAARFAGVLPPEVEARTFHAFVAPCGAL